MSQEILGWGWGGPTWQCRGISFWVSHLNVHVITSETVSRPWGPNWDRVADAEVGLNSGLSP